MGQPPDADSNAAVGHATAHPDDLEGVPTDALLGFIKHLARNRATAHRIAGRLTAVVLSRHVLTLRDIEVATDVPKSTLDRWAAPFKTPAGGDA